MARAQAQAAAHEAERFTRTFLSERKESLKYGVDTAEHNLDYHRQHEPTDSKLQVFLYQGPKQAREAWEGKLPVLEAKVAVARNTQAEWERSLATDGVAHKALWERFTARAPDALTITAMTLKAEEQRSERFDALRQYHWVEKVLESTLGRSMQATYEGVREKLVARFAREPQAMLPERLQGQVVQHREVQHQARELERDRSRGMGFER